MKKKEPLHNFLKMGRKQVEVHVVDENGNLIRKWRRPNRKFKKTRTNRMASESDLEWLENAIFKTALRHCWEELDWRPSRNGLRVLKKNKMNPY